MGAGGVSNNFNLSEGEVQHFLSSAVGGGEVFFQHFFGKSAISSRGLSCLIPKVIV